MQSSNKLSVGYYQEPRFKEGENGDAGSAPKRICQRCFAMKHYSKLVPAVVPHESFRDSVAALRRTAAPGSLFVYVVDATDFPGSVVPDLTDLVGPDKRLLVVVNKCDLLPRSVSWKRLEIWVRTHLKELDARLGNNVDEVAFVSALTGYGIRRLVSRIHAMRRGGDVFTVGAANVGKSSCINQLLNIMWNIPESSRRKAGSRSTSIPGIKAPPVKTVPLTTSPLPGTTLGTVTAPLPNQGSIFDTPGIIVDPEKQALLEILAHDGSRTLRDALPAKHTKPTTYRLKPGRSMFLGGMVRIDYTHPSPEAWVLLTWFGNLAVHVRKTEGADDFYFRHAGELLAPSRGVMADASHIRLSEWASEKSEMASPKHTHRRRREKERRAIVDVVLGGFGWFSVTPVEIEGMGTWDRTIRGAEFSVQSAAGVRVTAVAPMLPFEQSGKGPADWTTA